MSDRKTFISQCLDGDAFADEIDDHVAAWHEGGHQEDPDLASYLGMTAEEYALWVEQPSALEYIIFARHEGTPIAEALALASGQSLAARGLAPDQASKLHLWLKATGRV